MVRIVARQAKKPNRFCLFCDTGQQCFGAIREQLRFGEKLNWVPVPTGAYLGVFDGDLQSICLTGKIQKTVHKIPEKRVRPISL